MSIKQRLEEQIKTALKSGDKQRLSCLRMVKSKLQAKQVELRAKRGDEPLSDEEIVEVIGTYAKQRRDSIESYKQGGRDDLVRAEEEELKIVNEFLPRQLSDDELRERIVQAIEETAATTPKDMGKVMKAVTPKVKGIADGKKVSRLVRELLASEQ